MQGLSRCALRCFIACAALAMSFHCTAHAVPNQTKNTSAQIAEIAFPANKQIGGLYTVEASESIDEAYEERHWHGPAKGVLRVPTNRIYGLRFAENFKVTRDTLNLKGANLIQILDFSDAAVQDDGLDNLDKFTNLKMLELSSTSCGKHGFGQIAKVPTLEYLIVRQTTFSDDDLAAIAVNTRFRYMDFEQTQLTDACYKSIQRLRNLDHLKLDATAIGDKVALAAVALPRMKTLDLTSTKLSSNFTPTKVSPSLNKLMVDRTDVSGKFLSCGASFRGLRDLQMRGTKIDNDGIANLYKFPVLNSLNVEGTKIHGSAAIDSFAKCRHLYELNFSRTDLVNNLDELKRIKSLGKIILDRTPLSASAFAALKRLTFLREMTLRNTELDDAKVVELRRALPKCKFKIP